VLRTLFGGRPLQERVEGAQARHHQSAGVAQLAEHQLPKLRVAGSNPVSRFGSDAPWCNWQHA
jgi:hypothetical protein